MKIIVKNDLDKQDVLVLGLFTGEKLADASLQKEVDDALKRKVIKDEFGSTYTSGEKLVILLGKKSEMTTDKIRRALGKAVKFTKGKKRDSFSTDIAGKVKLDDEMLGRAVAEGLVLADYSFSKYMNEEKKKNPLKQVTIQHAGGKDFQNGLEVGHVIAENTNFAKDLVNEQAGVMTTEEMEKVARKVASEHNNINIKVLEKNDLEKLGLNALLGVGKGSATPPRLIILEYKGGSGKWTALVGKGICFDSGGYNLKPTKYIEDMHTDMGGSAAVLGTIKTLAELGVKKNVLGVMAMAENMVSSTAQHPGDIVKAYNGKTIQIGNTDAEGRLALADALSYTEDKYHPEIMIDLATLTGACVVALGYYAAGMVGNDEKLQDELRKAGDSSYDRVWPLPFYEEYQGLMDGAYTDLNNISTKGKGYESGSITAGVFLSKFVDKAKWAHLDIAGTAYVIEETDYQQKFATGSGVRVLSYWLLNKT